MIKINKSVIKILAVITLILATIDMISTLYALEIGLAESNKIVLILMNNFGKYFGLVITGLFEIGLILVMYLMYLRIDKNIEIFRKKGKFLICSIINIYILSIFIVNIILRFIIVYNNINIILST